MKRELMFNIDISPSRNKKVCQNCTHFSKYGVHLGYCSVKNGDKLDNQRCNKFEFNAK